MEDKTSKMSQLEPNWSPKKELVKFGGTMLLDPGVFNFRKDLVGDPTQQTPAGAPDLIALRATRPRALDSGARQPTNRQPTNQKTSKETSQQTKKPTNQQTNKATNQHHNKQQEPR